MKKLFKILTIILAIIPSTLTNIQCVYAEAEEQGLFIKAINPGYTVDEKSNIGEFVELARKNTDTPLLLTGYILGYTNSSGNFSILLEFLEDSWMTGENIILHYSGSSDGLAHLTYLKTLAMKAGPLTLMKDGEIIDSVCWTSKNECLSEFKPTNSTTIVRDLDTLEFSHQSEYIPIYNPDNYRVNQSEDETVISQCQSLEFSEILSYYESYQSEQFIEIYNPTADQILLDGCMLRYKNKTYILSGIIQPDDYYVRYLNDFVLTKNPATKNTLEIIDTTGEVVDVIDYPNGQKKATSFAKIGYDANGQELWKITYSPTPGEANDYQEYQTCPVGKVINTQTGNCVKTVETTETVCPEGKYLNPETGRCKAYEIEKEKACADGYELNPETNRCRKIKNNDGADYELITKEYQTKSDFVALYALIIVVAVGIIYVLFQFRHEIKRIFQKLFRIKPKVG